MVANPEMVIEQTMPINERQKNILALAIPLVAALGLRLFFLRYHWAIGFDEAHYLRMAASATAGAFDQVWHPYWPPMFPLFVAGLSSLISDVEAAARWLNVLAGVLVVVPVYALAQRLFGRGAAFWSALLCALFPPLAFADTTALAEPSYTALTMFGILLGLRALEKRSVLTGLATGALFGLAYLVKPEGVGYLLVFTSVATVAFVAAPACRSRAFVLATVAAAVAFLAVVAPYLLYLRQATGGWTISMKFQVNQQFAALGWSADRDPEIRHMLTDDNHILPIDLAYHEGTFKSLGARTQAEDQPAANDGGGLNPALQARKFIENFYHVTREAIPAVLTLAPLVLLVLGLAGQVWQRKQAVMQLYLLSFLAFFWLALVPFFHINLRYFQPQLPLAFIWAGQGVQVLHRWMQGSLDALAGDVKWFPARWRPAIGYILVTLFLVFFSYLPEFGKVVKRQPADADFWSDAVELKKAGEWLREQTSAFPNMMSYNKAVDFYAGGTDIRQGATFPVRNEIDRIIEYARYKKIDYLVISERYAEHFGNLQPLVEQTLVPPALELVYQDREPSGIRTVIYRLQREGNASMFTPDSTRR